MKQCQNCNAELKDQVKFCPKCGTAQEAVENHGDGSLTTNSTTNSSTSVETVTTVAPVREAAKITATVDMDLAKEQAKEQAKAYWSHFYQNFTRPGHQDPRSPGYYAWFTFVGVLISTYLFLWSVGIGIADLLIQLMRGDLPKFDQITVQPVDALGMYGKEYVSQILNSAIPRITLYLGILIIVAAFSIYLVKRFVLGVELSFTMALNRLVSYYPAYILIMLFYTLFARLMPASLVTAGPVLGFLYLYFMGVPAFATWQTEASAKVPMNWPNKIYYVAITYALILMTMGVLISIVR